MSDTEKPAAIGRTAQALSVTEVEHASAQCYFRPDTEEMVFIGSDAAAEFEQHWRDMILSMDRLHEAQAGYSSALEKYGQAYTQGRLAAEDAEPLIQAVENAQDSMEEQRKALLEKIGEFSTTGMKYQDVVELLPVVNTKKEVKSAEGKKNIGRRYVYVKKKTYDRYAVDKKLSNVSLKAKDKKGAGESIYSKTKDGRVRIDSKKLAGQLNLKMPTFKAELKHLPGMEEWLDRFKADGTVALEIFGTNIFGWAKAWNESLTYTDETHPSIDVSNGAQFMRYASNVGASAEYDRKNGNVAFKAEAAGSLAIAAGISVKTYYIPSRLGVNWAMASDHGGQVADIGMFRIALELQKSGFIGASNQLEAQLQVVTTPNKDHQAPTGQPGGRLPRFREMATRKAVFHQQMNAEDEGLSVSMEAFAGTRIEGSLKGSLQWMKPTEPADPEASGPTSEKSGKFTDICSIGSQIGGMAGAGAGGKFHCTFINGKFCFHIAASLCWGVGAKGGFLGEVAVKDVAEFGYWMAYQLYLARYNKINIVSEGAFKAYTWLCVVSLMNGGIGVRFAYRVLIGKIDSLEEDFKDVIDSITDIKEKTNAVTRRNELARNVLGNKKELIIYSPEAKGALLYLLTRHDFWDHVDAENYISEGLVPDIYHDRKLAVLAVLNSVQTYAEYGKVLCRMTRDGSKIKGDSVTIISRQRAELINFLKEGFNKDKSLESIERSLRVNEVISVFDNALDELKNIELGLRQDSYPGYALSMNNTVYYQLVSGPNPNYPENRWFELGSQDGTLRV